MRRKTTCGREASPSWRMLPLASSRLSAADHSVDRGRAFGTPNHSAIADQAL